MFHITLHPRSSTWPHLHHRHRRTRLATQPWHAKPALSRQNIASRQPASSTHPKSYPASPLLATISRPPESPFPTSPRPHPQARPQQYISHTSHHIPPPQQENTASVAAAFNAMQQRPPTTPPPPTHLFVYFYTQLLAYPAPPATLLHCSTSLVFHGSSSPQRAQNPH